MANEINLLLQQERLNRQALNQQRTLEQRETSIAQSAFNAQFTAIDKLMGEMAEASKNMSSPQEFNDLMDRMEESKTGMDLIDDNIDINILKVGQQKLINDTTIKRNEHLSSLRDRASNPSKQTNASGEPFTEGFGKALDDYEAMLIANTENIDKTTNDYLIREVKDIREKAQVYSILETLDVNKKREGVQLGSPSEQVKFDLEVNPMVEASKVAGSYTDALSPLKSFTGERFGELKSAISAGSDSHTLQEKQILINRLNVKSDLSVLHNTARQFSSNPLWNNAKIYKEMSAILPDFTNFIEGKDDKDLGIADIKGMLSQIDKFIIHATKGEKAKDYREKFPNTLSQLDPLNTAHIGKMENIIKEGTGAFKIDRTNPNKPVYRTESEGMVESWNSRLPSGGTTALFQAKALRDDLLQYAKNNTFLLNEQMPGYKKEENNVYRDITKGKNK